jgi:CBS domain-containing protein
MSKTFDQGKDEVANLCQYFTTNRQSFLAPGVKEAHVRQSLIDPFFEALGWDVRNDSMAAPQYREVIPEDSLDVEGQQKAPDYTFRVGTLPKFYVEAKKCGVNISADPAPAYQLRRYGFSAKLALSILTDFDELGVYDCVSRPRPGDKASHARIQYFGFNEYPDRWREIWDVFSREAVWSGTFDQYAASKRKRGTSEVDSEFLKDIEGWRDVLARNLALRNSDLSADDLNAAVQRIIDRIVFLRMAEDRGLESYGQLHKLCEQPDIYNRFMSGLCRKADQKYNSGLFHFQKEPGVSDAPDTLTPRLAVDDNALKPILQSLYFEHGCPYHFGVLPVEILGTVYERFLGKVIRLTAGHQAKVEEKPEVRKAGGVYYTPAYIVNYIVLNTIGKQIEGKSPADLAGGKTTPPFRVLDMACGSGSFLLGAYQALLDHCLMWHQANLSPKHAKAVYQNAKGETRLTIAERKRILTTHIYGVDIDRQAVETTKLSLLLKALEGENDTTLSRQMTLFHERALPNLSDNIKCGNSLIASDFSMVPEDLVRVHAFDWPAQFPDAMKSGGFDAIVGNPPWGALFSESELEYLRNHHRAIIVRMVDSFMYFAHASVERLRQGGFFGMILPDVMLYQTDTQRLRQFFTEKTSLSQICNMGDVFNQVTRPACIVVCLNAINSKQKVSVADFVSVLKEEKPRRIADKSSYTEVDQSRISQVPGCLFTTSGFSNYSLWERVSSCPSQRLADLADEDGIQRGVSPDLKAAFLVNRRTAEESKLEAEKLRPALTGGKQVKRYDIDRPDLLLIYTGRDDDYRRLPHICEYIDQFKDQITCKEVQQKKHSVYSLHRAREERIFLKPLKLVGVITEDEIVLALDDQRTFATDGLYLFGLKPSVDARYVMGVMNSRLFVSIYRLLTLEKGRALAQVKPTIIANFPIRTVDFTNPTDRASHDKLVGLVEKMLALTPKLRGATSESEKATLHNAITTTDAEIDRLVYELYGLTKEEIKIVEGEH